jgi:hypothetical protein
MGEIEKAYIAELEQRLSDWWNEILELEQRMKKANVEAGHKMYVQIQALRQQREDTSVLLQKLRESDHSEWEALKTELEKAWNGLRVGLDKMAKGFAREWDEGGK